jgi:hypothetical protein
LNNITNWLLAQMLMARPSTGDRFKSTDGGWPQGVNRTNHPYHGSRLPIQLANINIQEAPTRSVPLPSWNDTESLYYWYKLLNPAPLRDQSVLLDKEPDAGMLNPAPLSPQPETFGDPSRIPRSELFERRFRLPDR